METNKILNSDVLDIIFDGKNKDYGAYQLRKHYNKRLAKALMSISGVVLITLVGTVLANSMGKKKDGKLDVKDEIVLQSIPIEKPVAPPPPPPPPPPLPAPPPQVKMEQFTPPKIVEDIEVKNPPPTVTTLETSKIGPITQAGEDDKGIIAPPVETKGTGLVVAPKVDRVPDEGHFDKVEIEARFPGGPEAWRRFLERAMSNYPERAVENGTQGIVRIQMTVDKDGSITDVKALNDPGDGLGDYAVNIIKKGPKWIPAEQNGKNVTYRFVQTVTFQLAQ